MNKPLFLTKKVFSEPCSDYSPERLEHKIIKLLLLLTSENRLSDDFRGKNVVIKPNLLAKRDPNNCVTTNPEIVRAAATFFIKLHANVTIADSPGGVYNEAAINSLYKVCGMKWAAEMSGASLNHDFSYQAMSFKDGKTSKTFNIITPIANADLIVNLSRVKTHSLCLLSNSVKNLFGSVPGLQKAEQHARFPKREDFASYLVDLCLLTAPTINIADAIIGMEGNGPAGGILRNVGLLLGSTNPFALDLAVSDLIGFSPDEIETVKEAISRNLCPASASELIVVGTPLENYKCDFLRPDGAAKSLVKQLPFLFDGKLQKWIEPKPVVNLSKCVGCGECVKCCPAKTIQITNGKAKIVYENCIKCYCCQELCPKKAIDLKRKFFFNL